MFHQADVPEIIAYKLFPGVSYEEGALMKPFDVAVHGIERTGIEPGDVVLVFGSGRRKIDCRVKRHSLQAGYRCGLLGICTTGDCFGIRSVQDSRCGRTAVRLVR